MPAMSFAQRRKRLLEALKTPALLFSGGQISRNYSANWFPYRADSSFLYFFDRPEPGSAAFFDPAESIRAPLHQPSRVDCHKILSSWLEANVPSRPGTLVGSRTPQQSRITPVPTLGPASRTRCAVTTMAG